VSQRINPLKRRKSVPKKRSATRKVARSAKTGRFVKKGYAKKHSSTTVVETIKSPKRRKK
jgi:hypothetical protein